jgi:hypothetical protein
MKIKERNRADLLAGQIRDQEDNPEDRDEQIVASKIAQPRFTGLQAFEDDLRHSWPSFI